MVSFFFSQHHRRWSSLFCDSSPVASLLQPAFITLASHSRTVPVFFGQLLLQPTFTSLACHYPAVQIIVSSHPALFSQHLHSWPVLILLFNSSWTAIQPYTASIYNVCLVICSSSLFGSSILNHLPFNSSTLLVKGIQLANIESPAFDSSTLLLFQSKAFSPSPAWLVYTYGHPQSSSSCFSVRSCFISKPPAFWLVYPSSQGIQLVNIEPLQLTHPVVYPSSHLQYSSFKFRLAPSALLLLLPSTQLQLHFSRSIPLVNCSLTRPLSYFTASWLGSNFTRLSVYYYSSVNNQYYQSIILHFCQRDLCFDFSHMPYSIHLIQFAQAQSAQARTAMLSPGFRSSQEEEESRKVNQSAGDVELAKEKEDKHSQSDHLNDSSDQSQHRSVRITWRYNRSSQTPPGFSNDIYTLAYPLANGRRCKWERQARGEASVVCSTDWWSGCRSRQTPEVQSWCSPFQSQ